MFKWGLVIAGLIDINRPVEKVSLFQSAGKLVSTVNESYIYIFMIPFYMHNSLGYYRFNLGPLQHPNRPH